MNEIREWSAVICLAGLVAALMQGMMPNGSMERIAKFVFGAFVICVLTAPRAGAVPKTNLSFGNAEKTVAGNERLESALDSQVREEAEKSVTGLVVSELARIGIKCKNVSVDMDTNRDGSISITKIIVTLDEKYAAEREKTSDWLKKELGLQTEVVVNGG